MSRTVVVGDIHGMVAELKALIAEISLTKSDTLVLAGDLLDKGPHSSEVVRHLRELRVAGYNVVLVMGNHEEKHSRFRIARTRTPQGQTIKMKGVEEMEAITSTLSKEDIAFLESAVLVHRLPEFDSVVVHAGILPITSTLDDIDKSMSSKILRVRHVTGSPKTRLTIELEVRAYITCLEEVQDWKDAKIVKTTTRPIGEIVPLGEETPDDPFWAEVYDGRFGHVYFGHTPFQHAQEPVRFAHATGLDLGAVYGNRLAAAVLTPGSDPVFMSVQSSGKFAVSMTEE